MLRKPVQFLLTLTLMSGAFGICLAQSAGSIKGTVSDANGALIAGANVEATNDNTGEKRGTSTADNGTYNISNLPVGIYTVTTNSSGFSAATTKEVKVSVAFATEVSFVLTVGGATANVVITASDVQTQVNTNDQQLSTLLDNKKIIDLPLLNRNPNSLVLLAPGTVQSNSSLGGFSVNGSRERNNNFLVDGIDNNDAEVPGIPGGVSSPNIDATQEFRVITNSFTAEYGRNTGSIVVIATRSGSNDYHGNAYMYYRSGRFSARDFFDQTGHPDPLQRRQFGGSIGGHIIQDKLFFFTNYEGDRFNVGSQATRTVPSASARTGILNTPAGTCTGTDATNGHCGTLDIRKTGANNATGAFLGIGPNLGLNPAVTALLNLYPLGNDHAHDPLPGVFESFRFGFTQVNKSDTNATRVDYILSRKQSFSASYNFSQGDFSSGLFETFPGVGDEVRTPQRGQALALRLTSTLSASKTNELYFGGNRAKAKFNGAGDGSASATIPNAIDAAFAANGIPRALPFGGRNGTSLDLATGSITGLGVFDTQFRFSGTTVLGDNFIWTRNAHSFKMGFERRWVYANGANNFGRSETLNFAFPTTFNFPLLTRNSGGAMSRSGLAGTIQNYASFLYGLVAVQNQSQYFNKAGRRTDQDYRGFRTREMDLYFQDSWKIRSNLTLNLGVRWEYKGVPYEVNGQLSNLIGQDPSTIEPAGGFKFSLVGKNSGTNNQLYQKDWNNFGPRVGFAYSPNWSSGFISRLTGGPGRSSIRGGYGIVYDRVYGNLFGNARGNPPFQQDFQEIPFNVTDSGTLQEFGRPPIQVASTTVGSNAEIFPVLFANTGNNIFQTKFANPYEQKWNFGVQRELGRQFLLEVNYVGGHGVNELRTIDGQLTSIARCNATPSAPCGGTISTSGGTNLFKGRFNDAFFQTATNLSVGFSSYNSLQATVTKTLTNKSWGLGQMQGVYTWSHSIDNSADPLVAAAGERNFPRDSSGFAGGFNRPERGNSGFDVRHRFVFNFIYEVPLRFASRQLDRFLGNWELTGIWTAQSGSPFSVFGGNDSAGTGLSQRADFASSGNPLNRTPTTAQSARTQTGPARELFANPCPLDATNYATCTGGRTPRQGTVPRNAFVGPGFNKADFSVIKRFPITEKYKLRIQADFFNAFNRVNLGTPVTTINSFNFGQSTFTVSTPRVIQFAARVDF
ncbi:MAG TPA: TonB-dependent receptor [Pyrinomonadaceae bacterium]|nr:TonB-dependent receptor [Pyrinomonadaceae bacterium]